MLDDPVTVQHPTTMGEPVSPPEHTSLAVSRDGQALTIDFEELAVKASAPLTREFSVAIPIAGDTVPAAMEVAVSGYAYAFGSRSRRARTEEDGDVAAKLTVQVHDRPVPFFFYANSSGEFTHPVAARLRGAPECRITLALEVRPDSSIANFEAMLSVTTINVMFL